MQSLKVLVIVLGVVIVVGLGVVVVTVIQRLNAHGSRGFVSASLTLPKGCHVIGMAAAGDRLALRLGDGSDCQIVLFVDPQTGQETGRVGLLAQP